MLSFIQVGHWSTITPRKRRRRFPLNLYFRQAVMFWSQETRVTHRSIQPQYYISNNTNNSRLELVITFIAWDSFLTHG